VFLSEAVRVPPWAPSPSIWVATAHAVARPRAARATRTPLRRRNTSNSIGLLDGPPPSASQVWEPSSQAPNP